MLTILCGLVLFAILAFSFWIGGIFLAACLIAEALKWGLIGVGIYLIVKEIDKILR